MILGAVPGGLATPGTATRAAREDAATDLRVGATATPSAAAPDPKATTAARAPGRPDPARTLVD